MGLSSKPLQLLSAKEAAVRLAVTERTCAKMLRTGQLGGFKLSGKYWRTTERHVEAYVAREIQSWQSQFGSAA